MEAKVQVLAVDTVNANGRLYPRSVVESAIRSLNNRPLAVVHSDSFLKHNGAPPVSDVIGCANGIRVDGNYVVTDMRIDRIPDDLLRSGFEVTTAGFGSVSEDGVVTDFTLTAIAIGNY